MPYEALLRLAARDGFQLNGASSFIVRKHGKPLGRPVPNYSGASPINHPSKRALLEAAFGAICQPTAIDFSMIG